jgi:secondary thiamine-phosphate synthase enzyme
MTSHSESFCLSTSGKGTYEITDNVCSIARRCGVESGTVTVFLRHTSASLVIMENADPSARTDLHAYFDRLVPEDEAYFTHTYEGADDMPSHIRMALTASSIVVPILDGAPALGTWQGIFIFEHRTAPHTREIVVNVSGK